jgi:hypothetical protein
MKMRSFPRFCLAAVPATGTLWAVASPAGAHHDPDELALTGPLHGGASSRCIAMIDEIETPDRAADWVRSQLDVGGKIMGFGHAVYRAEDSRGVVLREAAERLG